MGKIFSLLLLLLFPAVAMAQKMPPAGYENWDVCPFECCTYRQWTADDAVAVHKSRSDTSPLVFRVQAGEDVQGLTGVVVTEQAGLVTLGKSLRDGFIKGSDQPQLSLTAGEVVYPLAPLGEGAFLFWYHGKVYRSSIDLGSSAAAGARPPRISWWKLVRNQAGQSGWTRSDHFKHVDACE